MKVITVANQKGGVGKSTIAFNVANALRRKGFKVGIQDYDSQGTILSLAYDEYIPLFTREDEIPSGDFDFLVIDTPPYKSDTYVDVFIHSDIVLIPTKPSPPDWDAMRKFFPLFEKAKYKNHHLKGVFIFNDLKQETNLYKQMSEEFKTFGIPILESQLLNRISYSQSIMADEGIYSEIDRKAQKEVDNLTNEILTHLGDGKASSKLR